MSVRALGTQPPRDLSRPFLRGAVTPCRCLRTVWTPSLEPAQPTSNSCNPPSPEQTGSNSRADTQARAPLSPATAPCNLSSCIFVGSRRTAAEVAVQSAGGQAMAGGKGKQGEAARNRYRFPFTTLHILPKPSLRSGPALAPCPLCKDFSQLTSLRHGPSSHAREPASQLPLGAGLIAGSSSRFPSAQRDCLSLPIFQMFKSGVLSRSPRGPTRSSGHAGGAGDTCRGEQKGSQCYGLEGSRSANL